VLKYKLFRHNIVVAAYPVFVYIVIQYSLLLSSCTCFGQFLCPTSGAQELYMQHLICARL